MYKKIQRMDPYASRCTGKHGDHIRPPRSQAQVRGRAPDNGDLFGRRVNRAELSLNNMGARH